MKLQKTIKIKIGKLSKRKQDILGILIRKNTKAINFCLQKAKKGKYITHNLVYKDLRKLNLPATVIHGCRAKSVEVIKSYYSKKGKKTFPELKNSRVRFDNIYAKLIKTNNKLFPYFISILYKAGTQSKQDNRIELPLIVNSDYQKEITQEIGTIYKLGASELVKYKGEFYIYISYSKDIELPILDESFSPIGVDIGISNLAVSVAQSSIKFFSGERISYKNNFFRKQKAILQRNGAFQEIRRLKGRQTRYNNYYINNISKNIIEQAKQESKPVIVMEDLTHILETTRANKKQRIRLHSWIFKRLQKAIEYKALWEGIPVKYIDPYHSSQICSKCGELNKRIKHIYKCKSCGFECNSDYNAGKNLQKLFLAKCQKERVPINSTSNCIKLESTKTEKDNIVRNLVQLEMEARIL